MPENGNWDLNEDHPFGVSGISANNCHISGNGFNFQNAVINGATLFSGKSEMAYLNFQNIRIISGAVFSASYYSHTLNFCQFAGEMTDSFFVAGGNSSYNVNCSGCGINMRLVGNSALKNSAHSCNLYAYYSNIKLGGSSSNPYPVYIGLMQGSLLDGNITGNNSIIHLLDESALSQIKIMLTNFSEIRKAGSTTSVVVCSDYVDGASISNLISATAEQLKDADWLTAHGFNCYWGGGAA